jgi:hypothetical protein
MRHFKLSRRALVAGAGGAGIALPFLEAMLPPRRTALAQTAPRRFVVAFAGMSLGRDNTGKLGDILPDVVGPGYDLKPPLQPLEPVKSDLTVVSGLRIPIGGPGGRASGFHKSSLSPLLSGAATTSASPDCQGATSDQIVANDAAFKGKTKFPFLAYRAQAQAYRGGGNVGVISWRARGQKNDPTVSPSLAFDNLFKGFAPPDPNDPAQVAARMRLLREEASVLDMVRTNADRLMRRLGRPDQVRLERHFDEIRALETRLKTIPLDGARAAGAARGCGAPPMPGADPMVTLGTAAGSGEVGYAGEEERAKVLTSLIVKAFACDMARVATLQLTCAQCFMNVEALVGVKMDLHELAHLSTIQGGKDVAQRKVMDMYGWHMKHWASVIAGLKNEIGPDGRPLLDTTVLVFVNEGGLGPAEGRNPSSHSTDNMMALVAGGRALGLKLGQHIKADGEHPARVLLSAMHAVGVPAPSLGDVSGRLAALAA